MIIYSILSVIYNVLDYLLFFSIPDLPDGIYEFLETGFEYISAGVGLLANYIHVEYALFLFGFIIGVDIAIAAYHLIMWVLRKIPFLAVE